MAGHIVERGTPAYWVTYLGTAPIFTPCRVTKVEETAQGEALATIQTDVIQTAGIVGTAVIARAATGVRGGKRVILRPSIGHPCALARPTEEV